MALLIIVAMIVAALLIAGLVLGITSLVVNVFGD